MEHKAPYATQRGYENLEKGCFDAVGPFDIPIIKPTHLKTKSFIPFNYMKTAADPENLGIHFFVDDYQFQRLWNKVRAYVAPLSKFKQILSPDFSTFSDFPVAMQIYNHYRKHWVAAYLQACGLDVIPTISWSDKSSFTWCFDGEPVGGCVAVSSVGCMKNKESSALFLDGYTEMISRLQPTEILFCGQVPAECKGNIIQISAFQETFKRRRE